MLGLIDLRFLSLIIVSFDQLARETESGMIRDSIISDLNIIIIETYYTTIYYGLAGKIYVLEINIFADKSRIPGGRKSCQKRKMIIILTVISLKKKNGRKVFQNNLKKLNLQKKTKYM
jgi:hypothetical protein